MTWIDRCLEADNAACRHLRTLPHAAATDRLLAGVSRATDDALAWVLLGLGAALVDRHRSRAWLLATATVITADRTSVVIKQAVGRPRPKFEDLAPLATAPSPFGFPSSHTASAVAAAVVSRPLTSPVRFRWLAWLIGVSRPYLGMHYPSDVLAGALVGGIAGRCGLVVLRRCGFLPARS